MVHTMTVGDARFVRLYEAHYASVWAYCRRRIDPDRVDDAVADVFLTAWRRIEELPPEDRVLPWLYGVAYRVLAHEWRGASRTLRLREKLGAVGVHAIDMPAEQVVMREESRLVVEAAARLKGSDREILRLAVWEELKQAQIAVALGISTDAVKKRLSRARRNLANEYVRLEKKRRQVPTAQEGGAW
jgi:RNA polymerase sigma factor (sigma-70 family)